MYNVQPDEYNAEFNYINDDVRYAYIKCINALERIHGRSVPTRSDVRTLKTSIVELVYVLVPLNRKGLETDALEPILNATLNTDIENGVGIIFLKKTLLMLGVMMGKAKLFKRSYGKQDTTYTKRFKKSGAAT